MFTLEVSTYHLEGVKEAHRLGVDRLELCDNIKEGGTTPSHGLIEAAVETGHPNIFVIIRPRGGDFLYTADEFEIIRKDILHAKKLGVQGVVCGLLLENGEIDLLRTCELVELARPMKFTFHRAFDMCNNPQKALEDLIEAGVDILLTSGQKNSAMEGISLLRELVEQASGRINILVGSGVNASNIVALHQATGATHFHMSAVKEVPSAMQFKNNALNMGNTTSCEYMRYTADFEKMRSAIHTLTHLKTQ